MVKVDYLKIIIMIKANELRIGNWIYDVRHKCNVQIEEIEPSWLHDYEPIPLTREILEQFGFEKMLGQGDGYAYMKNNFELWKGNGWEYFNYSITGREDDGINEPNVDVASVHQLQNLYFALTGKELEFKHDINTIDFGNGFVVGF